MIEAYVNAIAGDRWSATSAGAEPDAKVASLTVLALAEIGLSATAGTRSTAEIEGSGSPLIDVVITVSEDAAAAATNMSRRGILTLHWPLPDPTAAAGAFEERLEIYRAVLETIRSKVEDFLAEAGSAVAA